MRRAVLSIVLVAVALPAAASAAPRSVRGAQAEIDAARAPASQLVKVGEVRSGRRRVTRYRQVVGGLPVLGADTVVTEAPGTRGDLLVDGSRRIRRPPGATVSRARAIRAALRSRSATGRVRARRAILPRAGGARTVWRVVFRTARPIGAFELVVDARTARVLRVRDLARRAAGEVQIFDPNPVVANGGRGTLSDSRADSTFKSPNNLYEVQPLLRLLDAQCLVGLHARVELGGSEACAAAADFTFERSEPEFEAGMAYYHIDRTQNYIHSTLDLVTVNDRQTLAEADGTVDDSSFYLGVPEGQGSILFGLGGVDDAEDADVIVHEYGHAIQDNQVPGFGATPQGGAMGEGFGDYLAAAMSTQFEPSAAHDACIAEWDTLGTAGFPTNVDPPCLRRTDRDLTAAQVGPGTACNADIHCAGEAWSGALWDIRTGLDDLVADRKVIESHWSLTPESDFHAGALSLVAAYEADPSPGVRGQAPFVRALLTQRGLLDAERLDDSPATATALGLPGSHTGFLQRDRDDDDFYRVALTAGQGVVVRLRGSGHDFDLRLLRPGATSLNQPGATLEEAQAAGSNEDIFHRPTLTGTYYVDVHAFTGQGIYTVSVLPDRDSDTRPDSEDNCQAVLNPGQEDSDGDRIGDDCDRFPDDPANDVDRDGRAAAEDNCPRAANRSQTDWDGDDRGDACDASARVRVRKLRTRGRRITLRATYRPTLLRARAIRLSVQRRPCRRCKFGRGTRLRRGKDRGAGRVDFTLKVRRGFTYRFRARITDRRFRSRSASLSVRLP